MSYYPEPESNTKNQTKVELGLSNYARKFDIKKQLVLIHYNLLKDWFD